MTRARSTRARATLALRRYPEAMLTPDSPEFYLGLSRPGFFQPDPEDEQAMPQPMLMNGSLTYPIGQTNLPILADDKGRYWLPILPALRGMTWRFYQTNKKRWLEESPPTRPPLVELVIQPYERNTPIRLVLATR